MPFAPKPKAALFIAGHGSTENPDSSVPYFDHADEIRRRGLFAEVHCIFWKEEPSFREAWYLTDCEEIYVVPDFISEGYFTEEVIPRELGLAERGQTLFPKIQQKNGRQIHYCGPVGTHARMTEVILARAQEAVG